MRATVLFALVWMCRIAAADAVAVKVIEVSGDTAFVEPGRSAGLVPGTSVRFGARTLIVIEAADKTAALTLGPSRLAVGEAGVASLVTHAGEATERMATPRPLDELRHLWPPAPLPAASQAPEPVGFGEQHRDDLRLAIYGHAFANLDKSGTDAEAETRVVSSFAPVHDGPLAADVDVALRYFGTGYNAAERTPLFVRAAQLRLGPEADPALALGRLRYAASSLGMLDGGRVAVHVGPLEVAAFGGLIPDPVSGKPDTAASRFGTELILDQASAAWQPKLAVAAYGSTWQGHVDEERLSVAASAAHGNTFLDGWGELQMFSPDNPWGARPVEVTGAGASGEWRDHGNHLGFDVTFLRPERSLRLAAALPSDWLCAHNPLPGQVPETCIGENYWAATSASAGTRGRWWSLDAVGSVGETHSLVQAYDVSGYVRGEMSRAASRVFLVGSGGHTLNADWQGVEAGAGTTIGRVDVTLAYRPERLYYVAASNPYIVNNASIDLHYAMSRAFDVAMSAEGTKSADRDVVVLFATFVWRRL